MGDAGQDNTSHKQAGLKRPRLDLATANETAPNKDEGKGKKAKGKGKGKAQEHSGPVPFRSVAVTQAEKTVSERKSDERQLGKETIESNAADEKVEHKPLSNAD